MKDTVALQLEMSRWALHQNVAGLTHEESLVAPENGGNCANWVVGHLARTFDKILEVTGGEPNLSAEQRAPYERGSGPLDPAAAADFADLLAAYDESHERMQRHIASLSDEDLAAPAPFSPRNDPDETVGSLLTLIAFHQAYHTGQTGVLRRVAGHEGAIG